MKFVFSNVLYAGIESSQYEGKTFHKVILIDDQGDYDRITISCPAEILSKLPAPKTHVNVGVNVRQVGFKQYMDIYDISKVS